MRILNTFIFNTVCSTILYLFCKVVSQKDYVYEYFSSRLIQSIILLLLKYSIRNIFQYSKLNISSLRKFVQKIKIKRLCWELNLINIYLKWFDQTFLYLFFAKLLFPNPFECIWLYFLFLPNNSISLFYSSLSSSPPAYFPPFYYSLCLISYNKIINKSNHKTYLICNSRCLHNSII